MLQRIWTRGPAGPVADDQRPGRCGSGIVCPYSLDVPGGVQSHVLDLARALIALGHPVSVLAPADDDGRRRAAAARVRHPGRPVDERAVQRLGRPDHVRARVLRPGPALARRPRLRRAAPARARHVQPVVAGAVRGRGADRGDVPHLHRAVARDAGVRAADQRADGEGDGADRGVPDGAPGAGRAPGRRRRGDPERRRRRRCSPAARCCRATRAPGTPSGSSAGSASRARAWRCCSTRCACSRRSARTCGCSWSAGATPDGAAPRRRARSSPTGSTCSAPSTT